MTQTAIDSPLDYALALFPQEKLGFILLIALAVFALTQAIKVIFRISQKLPTLGQTALRLVAVGSAFPLAYGVWPVKDLAAIAPIALISWGLAHLTAEKGMAALAEFYPRVYRVLNAEKNRRLEDNGPKRGQYERRCEK